MELYEIRNMNLKPLQPIEIRYKRKFGKIQRTTCYFNNASKKNVEVFRNLDENNAGKNKRKSKLEDIDWIKVLTPYPKF